MMSPSHRTGTIASGDVTLFYRHFEPAAGSARGVPLLIAHGANYYDSGDWVEVAGALSRDREVAAWDMRGFGESSWSPGKDYSYDAIVGDMNALLAHFGWRKAVIMGHSLGGSYALVFAAHVPQRAAGLILVDHCPGRTSPTALSVNNKPKIHPTLESALADTSREKSLAHDSPAWARVAAIFKPVDGGFVFRRDPDYGNRVPIAAGGWTARLKPTDTWSELAEVRVPVLILRGTRSDRYSPEALARVAAEFAPVHVADVDAGHDIAGAASDTLIRLVSGFVAERVDADKAA